MSIPQHRKNRAKSRNVPITIFNEYVQCEWEWCLCKATEIHHIYCSYRTTRNDNPTWLIALCNEHHRYIHSRNNHQNRQMLLDTVLLILKNINDKKWT